RTWSIDPCSVSERFVRKIISKAFKLSRGYSFLSERTVFAIRLSNCRRKRQKSEKAFSSIRSTRTEHSGFIHESIRNFRQVPIYGSSEAERNYSFLLRHKPPRKDYQRK